MENTRYKILLVEDDKLDQMAFKQVMESSEFSYDCTVAGSVQEACNILGSERFDVVIADYLLGDGTAFDILDLVKSVPIIFVTGAGDEEVAIKAWKTGAYDYVIKDHERSYLKTLPITIENATRHKKMEGRLRLLSHAIVSTDDSVYITDLEGRIIFVNKAFCETYGYQEEEVIGKDCDILWKKGALVTDPESVHRAILGWEVGFFHKRKDGSEFPVSISRSGVKDEDGNEVALVVIARDISERMQIENDFRTANRELQRQNRLKRQLAVATCHQLLPLMIELKNIVLSAATGALGEVSPKLREKLEFADKNVDKVRGIINEFLEISEIDESRTETELTDFSFSSAVS
jgi:PAS domain S-box-containing protein